MGKTWILVAMEREAESLGLDCFITGIGADSLPPIAEDDTIINVGYCGGYGYRVGEIVEPVVSVDMDAGTATLLDNHFDCPKALCLTAREFVTQPAVKLPAVYDMELSKLAQIKCAGLYALKIVSDNLDEADCEAFNDAAAWERVRTLLEELK